MSELAVSDSDLTVLGVRVTHSDRVVWPAAPGAEPVTKADLAAYYAAAAERLLPHVRGRPCAVIRSPEGIEGTRIYQRHPATMRLEHATLHDVGDAEPHLGFDTPEALVEAAQWSVTEFHPWSCAPGKPDTPGRLVFDLDPDPKAQLSSVVAAAREAADRLRALGLTPFLRTTGGKGLHVVVPLIATGPDAASWDQAKAFAKRICDEMAADSPDLYTTSLPKEDRRGRLFLDHLRNARTATAVACYSPRARPGATVAFPLSWDKATDTLRTSDYTIRSVTALLDGPDPWARYDEGAAPLPD